MTKVLQAGVAGAEVEVGALREGWKSSSKSSETEHRERGDHSQHGCSHG